VEKKKNILKNIPSTQIFDFFSLSFRPSLLFNPGLLNVTGFEVLSFAGVLEFLVIYVFCNLNTFFKTIYASLKYNQNLGGKNKTFVFSTLV